MLNYETLLSSYDDKLTLMQWLKKVEKALAGASASSFEVIKTGNATLHFRINFEDGTYLESGDIVLQQGESVASGEIRNGHLFLTLTNGQELDCGLLFNGEVPSLEVRSLEVTGGLIVGDDANAAIGGDLVVHGLTEVQNLLAYGYVKTDTLTAAGNEIKTEKPVIEVMNGYSFVKEPSAESDCNFNYVSVCKNGNKITFAFLIEITPSVNWPTNESQRLGTYIVPNSIFLALVPSVVGSISSVSCTRGYAYASVNSGVALDIFFQRLNVNELSIVVYPDSEMEAGRKYTLRHELTFLLSDNLVA